MIKYSIIIVNYKTPQLVLQCLRGLELRSHPEMEVIVVDNASEDDSETLIKKEFEAVQFYQMGYNSGFARANNKGIRSARGSIVLLLNSDTICKDDTVYRCFERLEQDAAIACGVQLVNADGSPQISGNFFMIGGLNYLMALPYVGSLIRWIGLSAGVKKTNLQNTTTTTEVDWINGAFLMVKKTACEKAGLLDEDFFLYAEEAEWCSRLKNYGKMLIYGDLNITHLEGESSSTAFGSKAKGYQNLSDRKGFQIMISNFVRFRKQHGVFWYLFHLAANLFTVFIFFIILSGKSLVWPVKIKEDWKEWVGYTKNVLRSFSYFFKILFNQSHFYKVL